MAADKLRLVKNFISTWKNRGYEKGDSQSFWYQLLHDVLDVETPANFIMFELPVHLKKAKFIDAYIPSTKVLIEQKSLSLDLHKAKKQSDNAMLTPYEQALRYTAGMKYSERPRWIVTSNFQSFLVYDMEGPDSEPFCINLDDLEREWHLLSFLVEDTDAVLKHEKAISIKAGELIGNLYDTLRGQYIDFNNVHTINSLNVLCVRLVFCLFAEDSSLFGVNRGSFCNYMRAFKAAQMRDALVALFRILNTPYELRSPYENSSLLEFPYVNGGMFSDESIEIPGISDAIAKILLEDCGSEFDWSGISPTIFGALFEDTMNPETREVGCMHYTSVENIHRCIDPLFIDSLKKKVQIALQIKNDSQRINALLVLQEEMSMLTFLDPACGSGNFLTETYLSLRKIENEIIAHLFSLNCYKYVSADVIKVSINQFYGIEINDFAVTVAKAALWIAEAQMMRATEMIVGKELCFFPLKNHANIVKGDALTMHWDEMNPQVRYSYIIGNPPYKGKKSTDNSQKIALVSVIGKDSPRPGNMDLACGWFLKAAKYMRGKDTKTSFVTTVNITRGEQVSLLWTPILQKYGCVINYAYQPFLWDNASKKKAQVHCVIIGYSCDKDTKPVLMSEEHPSVIVENISPYLRAEETTLITSRKSPLCDIPSTGIGNKPIDNSNFLFTPEEKAAFIAKEPLSKDFFVEWYGGDEIIKGKKRYFLYLANCNPSVLRKMPLCKERIENVKRFRSKSTSEGTRKLAMFPTKFHVTNIPKSDFVVIPEVTSECRDYIPMEYVYIEDAQRKLFSNLVKLMPNATLYHFGVLQSSVHMIWTKGVCGYKDFRPRYSTEIVFNNFPWPTPTTQQMDKIKKSAKKILNVRKRYPESSLADLYDVSTMPDDLRLAHVKNDQYVKEAYGIKAGASDEEIMNLLMESYSSLIQK